MGGGSSEGGVQDPVSGFASSVSSSNKRIVLQEQAETLADRGSDRNSSTERGSRTCTRPLRRCGVLQPSICGTKGKRFLASYNRSEETEQDVGDSKVQDGDSTVNLVSVNSRPVHFQYRSYGRVLSSSNASKFKKVSTNSIRRTSIPIQGSALRVKHIPLDFYQGDVRDQGYGTSSGHSVASVPRRLVGSSYGFPHRDTSVELSDGTLQQSGIVSQQGQIGIGSQPRLHLHRCSVQPHSRQSISKRNEFVEDERDSCRVPSICFSNCKEVAVAIGNSKLPVQIHSSGQASHKTTSMESSQQLETEHRFSRSSDSSSSSDQTASVLVAQPTDGSSGSSFVSSPVHSQNIHRCVDPRLGGSCRRCSVPREMVNPRTEVAHKCVGTQSSSFDVGESHASTTVSHFDRVGQYDSSGLCQSRGRNAFIHNDAGDFSVIQTVRDVQLDNQSKIYPRPSQCDSRSVIKTGSDSTIRMVNPSQSVGEDFSQVGETEGRHIRDKTQFQVSNVCVTSARPISSGSRCLVNGVRESGSICLSSSSNLAQSDPEVSADQELQVDRDCAFLAKTGMVSSSEHSISRRTNSASLVEQSPKTISRSQSVSLLPRNSQSSRLAVGQEFLIKNKGYSQKAAKKISAPQAKSTLKVYDGKWKIWENWCNEEHIDPFYPSNPQVADFLIWLFEEKKWEVITIKGYRSALSSALKHHTGLNVGKDQDISDLFEDFKRERPRKKHVQPEWDVAFVLWSLTQPPFEPIRDPNKVHLLFLTWKVTFLLLLASGARRGELHAIKNENVHYNDKQGYLTLTPSPDFVSKTSLRRGEALKPFRIPSLCRLLPKDMREDRALCPVRCTNVYRTRTEDMREGKSLLLISVLPNHSTDICKNTISSWIKNLIKYVYRNPHDKVLELTGTRTHEIRGIAASLIFKGVPAVEDILSAGSWKNETTFIKHYLKDLSGLNSDTLKRLGPIVAAQKIVVHSEIS